MRWLSLALVAALLAAAPAARADEVPAPVAAKSASRIVMTWVPPYSRAASWDKLHAKYGGYGPANALTHLGLQFWKPTAEGALVRVSAFGAISDAEVRSYVKWAHDRGIKVMLTVYNGEPSWDWATAKSAFADNKAAFVAALLAEMKKFKLDGVDVDIEGPGIDPTPDDKATYLAFLTSLAAGAHARGKTVQVDSFHYVYNAPNQTWWADMFPIVDAISSMGYEDLGRNAPEWQAYSAQRAAAGSNANMAKLIIGAPTYLETWQGDAALDQMAWFTPKSIRTGVGLWDAQDSSAAFSSAPVWRTLAKIRKQN